MSLLVLAIVVEGDVLQDGETGDQTLFLAAFRQQANAAHQCLIRAGKAGLDAIDLDLAARSGMRAKHGQHRFRTPGTDKPGKTEYLTLPQGKARDRPAFFS